MKIRLIKPWQYRKVGTILDPPDGVANLLITRRFAVAVEAECLVPSVAATAEVEVDQPRRQPRRMRTTA